MLFAKQKGTNAHVVGNLFQKTKMSRAHVVQRYYPQATKDRVKAKGGNNVR